MPPHVSERVLLDLQGSAPTLNFIVNDILVNLHWVWTALALGFAILEVLMPFFGFIFAAGAALIAALSAALHVGWELQLALFAGSLLASLLLLRPRIIKKVYSAGGGIPSRTTQLVGKRGSVTDPIDAATKLGRASFDGQDWAIRCTDAVEVGSAVQVESADGIILNVRKV